MKTKEILHFLKDIEGIREKISLKKMESTRRGEDFNVFNVLGLWSEEVRLHSAFLAELLNPVGSHGCGDELLKAFLKELGINDDNDVSLGKATVTSEFYIGTIDEKSENGGRIDILVEMPRESGMPSLVIENKIYASDQYNQLRRYHNYACHHLKNFRIIYLTLHGSLPSASSIGEGREINFDCISYSEHISKWLKRCATIAYDKPKVRETIIQYLHLLKQLTDQSMNETNPLVDFIVSNSKNLISALCVCSYRDEIIKQALTKIIIPHLEKIAESANKEDSSITVKFESDAEFINLTPVTQKGFEYNISNKEAQKNVCLKFLFQNLGLVGLYYGIASQKTSSNVDICDVFGNQNVYWPWGWKWFDGYRNWNGETLPQIIEEITQDGENSKFSATIKNAISVVSKLCK